MPAVRVAVAQYWVSSDVEQNLAKCLEMIDRACTPPDGGPSPQLLLLPELCNHPSRYQSQEHAYEVACAVPGPFVDAVAERARRYRTHIGLNVTVRAEPPTVHDTTILIGPDGEVLALGEKQYLFSHEQDCIAIGRNASQVVDTEIGRIGLYICMDGLIPETTRCLAVQGAQVLINPLNSGGPDEEHLHVPARAAENHVWVLSCNNVGPIAGGHARNYVGGSQIVGPTGSPVARASATDEDIVYATIDPAAADDKRVGQDNDLLADRRPELYGLLTVPNDELPVVGLDPEALLPRLRAAAVQVSFDGDTGRTVERAIEASRAVTATGARLVVLPELFAFDPARIGENPANAAARSGGVLAQFQALAVESGAWFVLSLVEAEAGRYYSTAYLVDGQGQVAGRYRQTHLWATERCWATPGDDFPVFETPYGRLGIMLGYDGTLAEPARLLTLLGADLIAYPTTWRLDWEPALGIVERSAENRITIVAAARADSPVARGSLIVAAERFPTNPHWWIRSPEPIECSPGNGVTLAVGIAAVYGRDKRDHPRTDQVRNRRPELYGVLAQPAPARRTTTSLASGLA